MDLSKYKKILSNFSKADIVDLLGEKLHNALMEWESNDELYTKNSLINILVSVYGFSMFKKKEFREMFFQKISYDDLKVLFPELSNLTYEDLSKKAANIKFEKNSFYPYFINTYLDCPEYEFDDSIIESKHELVSRCTDRFFELFDYQYLIKQQTLSEIEKFKDKGRKILIHMPTGTGKTKTTMHILSHYLNFINKHTGIIVWIADRNELLIQALETFRNVWGHLGLFDAHVEKSWGVGDYEITDGMLFISIQALMTMRNDNIDLFNSIKKKTNLIVFDECHKIGADKTKEVLTDLSSSDNNKKRSLIGLTATPGRTTEQSFENIQFTEYFDKIIEIDVQTINRINMSELAALNSTAPKDVIKYFQTRQILSQLEKEELVYETDEETVAKLEKEIKNSREDFSKDLINKIAQNRARNSVILNKLIELNSLKKPTIVFACSVDHARMISAFLNIENIPNSLVYGEMESSIRKKAIDDFKDRDNETNIIINYDILTTGFDSTNIECVFITRPTKSVILYSQMIGRGLRGPQMGGNEKCLLIDVKENLNAYDENEAFSHFKSYWR